MFPLTRFEFNVCFFGYWCSFLAKRWLFFAISHATLIYLIRWLLRSGQFKAQVEPVILRFFASKNRMTRVMVLQNCPAFVGQLDRTLVNGKIFSDVLSGFADTNKTMREETIKVMVGHDCECAGVMKQLAAGTRVRALCLLHVLRVRLFSTRGIMRRRKTQPNLCSGCLAVLCTRIVTGGARACSECRKPLPDAPAIQPPYERDERRC